MEEHHLTRAHIYIATATSQKKRQMVKEIIRVQNKMSVGIIEFG